MGDKGVKVNSPSGPISESAAVNAQRAHSLVMSACDELGEAKMLCAHVAKEAPTLNAISGILGGTLDLLDKTVASQLGEFVADVWENAPTETNDKFMVIHAADKINLADSQWRRAAATLWEVSSWGDVPDLPERARILVEKYSILAAAISTLTSETTTLAQDVADTFEVPNDDQ